MNTFELLKELAKKPSLEIQYALLTLLLSGKIKFTDLNLAYVQALENIKNDNADKMAEKNCSILDLLIYFGKETKDNHAAIHRALYNLNESKQFQMQTLNERYNFNEEEDKQLSYYWRERNNSKQQ